MRILSTGYTHNKNAQDPEAWLGRIAFYTPILEALARTHSVTSIEHIAAKAELQRHGVRYLFQPLRAWRRWLPAGKHRLVKDLKPGLVLVNGFGYPFALLQLRRALGAKPLICLWHRADKPPTGIRRWLQRRVDRAVDRYLFTAPGNAAPWLQSGCIADERKIRYVLQSTSSFTPGDRAEARSAPGFGDEPVYAWIGRADENKDPICVLDAFDQYLEQAPTARLIFVCREGPLSAAVLARLHASSRLQMAVIYRQGESHEALQNWLRAADYIISSSHSEGSGIAVVEALSCGCMPILSKIPSLSQISGGLGYSFTPGDRSALLAALKKTNSLPGAAARQQVLAHFEKTLSARAIASALEILAGA